MSDYDVAQICLNGHVITELALKPDYRQDFCSRCGALSPIFENPQTRSAKLPRLTSPGRAAQA